MSQSSEIINYIKGMRANGASDDNIRRLLVGAGWDEAAITEAFGQIDASINTVAPLSQETVPSFQQALHPSAAVSVTPVSSSALPGGAISPARKLLKQAIKDLFSRYGLVLTPVLAVAASFTAAMFIGTKLSPLASVLVGAVLWAVLVFTIMYLIIVFRREIHLTFSEYLKATVKKFLPTVWVGILSLIITLGSSVFLALPGIIFAVWFSQALFALAAEDHKGSAALLRSRQLTRGRFWKTLWRFAFFQIIVVLVNSIFIAVSVIFLGGPLVALVFGGAAGKLLSNLTVFIPLLIFLAVNFLFFFPLEFAYLGAYFRNLQAATAEPFIYDRKQFLKYLAIGIAGMLILAGLFAYSLYLKKNTDTGVNRNVIPLNELQERFTE